MSHFSRLKTKFVNKDLLLQSLKDLGYEAEGGEGLQLKGFGSSKTPVDVLVHLRLSYDIGFEKRGGSYEIIADWFGVRGIKAKDFEQKLAQRYAYLTARSQMEQQGFNLVEETEEGGKIRLVLRRMA